MAEEEVLLGDGFKDGRPVVDAFFGRGIRLTLTVWLFSFESYNWAVNGV